MSRKVVGPFAAKYRQGCHYHCGRAIKPAQHVYQITTNSGRKRYAHATCHDFAEGQTGPTGTAA